jgi:tRNA-splicing ligase RtcB
MVSMAIFNKISDYEWEIPRSYRSDMRVPVRFFASRELLEASLGDLSINQAVNAATLPGLVDHVMVMPDMHQGYGFPIGGVAATRYPEGVISPGGIGYDINCGVRLLSSSISLEAAEGHLNDLAIALEQACPNGVGTKGFIKLSDKDLDEVCQTGSRWALKRKYATQEDLRRTEEEGCITGADASKVSARAKARGREQLGTLGSGNHYLEVDVVDEVFDVEAAQVMGLIPGCLVLMIHCGSRGLGHQVCTDYVHELQSAVKKYAIQLPDRELVCAPLTSVEGKNYLAAMRCAANYAFANRQILAHQVRGAFESVLRAVDKNLWLRQVYDVAHNIGKIETHVVDGEKVIVCVHRKGATRAFGPGDPALPEEYRPIGQPVLVGGSMGTASWVLVGTEKSMVRSLGSTCHGAGRVMSRSKSKHNVRGEQLLSDLKKRGVIIRAGSMSGLAEEAPEAYKDVDKVVEAVQGAGISRKVARLKPVIVVKG